MSALFPLASPHATKMLPAHNNNVAGKKKQPYEKFQTLRKTGTGITDDK